MYIVGAGGIGLTLATTLRTVSLVEKDAAKREHRPSVNGVSLDVPVIAWDSWQASPGDTVFLCVKCFDNAEILERLPNDVNLIPVQNGYDETLERRCHEFEGIASYVALCEPGTLNARITRPGELHFGPRGSPDWSIQIPQSNFFPIKVVPDIRPIKATKLMYNAAISPLAAGAGVDNGELLDDPLARTLFFALIQENYRILTNAGVPLGKVGPFHPKTVSRILRTPMLATVMAKFFVRSLRGTYCSMAGDIEKGRTELANYTGHLLRLAGATPAPLNRAVFDEVSKLTKPDRGVLDLLARRASEG